MEPSGWTDSPYVGICINPRATIRTIVDRDPTDRVLALVLVAAAIAALTGAIHGYEYNPTAFTIGGKSIPEVPWRIEELMKVWGLTTAMLLAVPLLYISGAIFRWSGSLFGGTANAVEVRAALGWLKVPSILMTLASFAVGFLVPPPAQPSTPGLITSVLQVWRSMLPSMIILSPLWLWSWVVWLRCLGEVHRFSVWRALLTSLIGDVLLAAVAMVVGAVWGLVGGLALRTGIDSYRLLWTMVAVSTSMILLGVVLFLKYARLRAQADA